MFSLQQSASQSQSAPTRALVGRPFLRLYINDLAAIDTAARRVQAEPWMRSPIRARSKELFARYVRDEWLSRRHPGYVPGVLHTTAAKLVEELGWSPMTYKRAARLLVEAGLVTIRRRGECRDHQAHCVGIVVTFRTQMGPNHHFPVKTDTEKRGRGAPDGPSGGDRLTHEDRADAARVYRNRLTSWQEQGFASHEAALEAIAWAIHRKR